MFTVCLLGNSGTGKTSWFNRVMYGEWSPNFDPTLDTYEVKTKLDEETSVKFRDTPGQWMYNPDTRAFTDVDLFMVFASDNKLSQKRVRQWISLGHAYSPDARIMIIVNKCELKDMVVPKTIDDKPVVTMSVKSRENCKMPLEIIKEYIRRKI